MKQILLLCIFIFLFIGYADSNGKFSFDIIPKPKLVESYSGEFIIDNKVEIFCKDTSVCKYAENLIRTISNSSGIYLRMTNKPKGKYISFELESNYDSEEYFIDIDETRINIHSSSTSGIYYALQTLLQLLPAELESNDKHTVNEIKLPCVKIHDYPVMKYRGVMIDVCRHFFTVEELKKQIEILGSLKINKLHLHLTDNQGWRIEIKKYPELVQKSSVAETYNNKKYGPFYYTQNEIRDIIKYADYHNIEVIPEIEFPGHSLSVLVPFPELSCTGGPFVSEQVFGYEENVFCVGNDSVYCFMQDVLTEVANLFPSEYIHIGGDECSKKMWKQCPKCQAKARKMGLESKNGITVEELLQSYAINRLEQFISNKLKKKMIGWHEVLEGGINKNVTVMSWRDTQIGYNAALNGYDVIMSPMPEGFYLCDYQGAVEVEPAASGEFSSIKKLYNYNARGDNTDSSVKSHIIGLEACAWTEWCSDLNTLEYFMYPRVIALSENAWTSVDQKDWDDFQKRLDNIYIRLKYKGVNFHIPMPEGVLTRNVIIPKDTVNLFLKNSRSLPMVYTCDGTDPTVISKLLPEKLVLNNSCTLKVATLVAKKILSPVRTIVIDKQSHPKPAVNETFEGIRLQIANGCFDNINELPENIFSKDTIINSLKDYNKEKFNFRKPSIAIYTGYFEVPETSIYVFMSNDDELWIDDENIILNKSSSRFYACKKEVYLEKGYHKFKIVFSNRLKDGFATCWYNIGFVYNKKK